MKKILFVTSEAAPFAHTGGLGEVASALPKSLNGKGLKDRGKDGGSGRMKQTGDRENDSDRSDGYSNMECRVILPLYASIGEEYRGKMEYLGKRDVSLSWRKQHAGLYRTELDGVIYYFIDNEYYFQREGLYGHMDDGERFSFFSKAVFELMDLMDYRADILHANDWQTALVPVYQYALYRIPHLKTVFTIHNVEYQGRYGNEVLGDIIDIPPSWYHLLDYDGYVNLMKGAVECANLVTTVSPTYARELLTPEFAWGLDPIIRRNEGKIRGILNGIDTELYNPSKDRALAANYSWRNPDGKKECKKALQEEMGLPLEENVPLMAMITRLVPAKGIDLMVEKMDEILENMDVQFVLLGTGERGYEEFFRSLQERHGGRAVCRIDFDVALSRRIYAGADIFLMPSRSEACGLAQMIACRYGTVPVVHQTGGLADSIDDCRLGRGKGFAFGGFTGDEFYDAVGAAVKLYRDRKNWSALVDYDMKRNFGWKKAAEEYVRLYSLLEEEAGGK